MFHIKPKHFNIRFVSRHAPPEEKDEVKKQFRISLEQLYDSLSPNDDKILLGDFNAKVDYEGTLRGTTGRDSLHDIPTDNSQCLIYFASSRNLVKLYHFQHEPIY